MRHGKGEALKGRRLHCPVSSLLIHIIKVRKDPSVFSASVVSNESSLPHVCLMIACLHLLFSNTSSHTLCGYGVMGQCVLNQSYCGFYGQNYSYNLISTFACFCFLYMPLFYLQGAGCCVDNLGRLYLQALGQSPNSVANLQLDKMISQVQLPPGK